MVSLDYTAHPSAEAGLLACAERVAARHDVLAVAVEHRTGHLEVGDLAVVVAVGAVHRGAALAACTELIDEIKAQVPIWKEQAVRLRPYGLGRPPMTRPDLDGVRLGRALFVAPAIVLAVLSGALRRLESGRHREHAGYGQGPADHLDRGHAPPIRRPDDSISPSCPVRPPTPG